MEVGQFVTQFTIRVHYGEGSTPTWEILLSRGLPLIHARTLPDNC